MHCGPAAAAAGPMGPPRMDFSGGGMSPLDAPRKRKSQRKDAAPGNVVKCAPDLAQTGIWSWKRTKIRLNQQSGTDGIVVRPQLMREQLPSQNQTSRRRGYIVGIKPPKLVRRKGVKTWGGGGGYPSPVQRAAGLFSGSSCSTCCCGSLRSGLANKQRVNSGSLMSKNKNV